MKAVLSPFRKNDKKDRTTKPPSAAEVDLDREYIQPIETTWKAARTGIRGVFGGRARTTGGPLRALKNRGLPVSKTKHIDLASPEQSSNAEFTKSLSSDSPSEKSKDFENLLNPPARRRFSHLGTTSPCLPPPKPMRACLSQSSLLVRESSVATSASTTDESHGPEHSMRGLDEPLDAGMKREPKKYRTRRLSIQGDVAPLSTSQHSSFSHLAASAQDWKRIEGSTPPKQDRVGETLVSPPRSVASSRKRGVGGSPISSDQDDMSSYGCLSASLSSSSTSARPIRSRSRIFSPDASCPPMLPFSLPTIDALANPTNQRSPSNHDRGVMDIDSDHDSHDEGSEVDAHESSFEHENTAPMHPEYDICQQAETAQDILESMSSYEHVKFLIRALRSEAKTIPTMFGEKTSWTVAPKRSWDRKRRATFYQWATSKLGFTVRAIGNSSSYLQISKQKGIKVLEKLTKAVVLYKEANLEKKGAHNSQAGPANATFNFMDQFNGRPSSMTHLRRRSSMSQQISPLGAPTRQSYDTCDSAALDLASRLQNLSVLESHPRQSDASVQTLVRMVTLEQQINPPGSARPSLEHSVVDSQDIMLHIHGRTHDDDTLYRRPPRTSASSIRSIMSLGSHRSGAPFPTINATQSFECVETPCMNDEKNWGSCPFDGRDWGDSERCESPTLEELTKRFEESTSQAGMERILESSSSAVGSALNFEFELECEAHNNDDFKVSESPDSEKYDAPSDYPVVDVKEQQKRRKTFAKHRRMTLCHQLAQSNDICIVPFQQTKIFPDNLSLRRNSIRDRITSEESIDTVSDGFDVIVDWEGKDVPLNKIFAFLSESELKRQASLVSRRWADVAARAHATLMSACVNFLLDQGNEEDDASIDDDDGHKEDTSDLDIVHLPVMDSVAKSMERSWSYLTQTFPWARFLAEGGMKKVYKAFNTQVGAEEAIAVMDVDHIREKSLIAAELAISSLLSDLVRRSVCPNFVLIRGIFNCPFDPPESHWGSEDIAAPKGSVYDPLRCDPPPFQPSVGYPGRYHYLRMELCDGGDAEEYIKSQPNAVISPRLAQSILFQTAFALHAAADRCSMKHYDIKLLNLFLQRVPASNDRQCKEIVLRYGLGSHIFSLQMPAREAFFAKLADYGTANVKPETNGQPVTIGQFTTIENTPPDFMILGDKATQGHGHDNWGLGLAMLHLFTGEAPYEEILDDVICPPALKKRLRRLWEDESIEGFEVIRSVILSDVELDEAGHIVEGEPDETLYNTLYRALVLFGIPENQFRRKECPKVWDAIIDCLVGNAKPGKGVRGQGTRQRKGPDSSQYHRDCRQFSVKMGYNRSIARARATLERMDGGLELLFGLCNFDPAKRWSAMDVLNSDFMSSLREKPGVDYEAGTAVHSYTAFSTHC